MLVIKGRVSGFVWAKHTRDQVPEEAFKAIVDWCHRFGLPHSVRFYGRRSFHSRFIEKLKQMGIQHIYTYLSHSKSNSGVDQAIRSVKHYLTRDSIKKVTQELVDRITFSINNHAQDNSRTPTKRFFGRAPRTYIPNSVEIFPWFVISDH